MKKRSPGKGCFKLETQEQVNKTERLDMKMQEMAASIDEAVKYNATELADKTGSPEMEELQTTGINECDLKKRKRRDWNHFCGSQNFQKKLCFSPVASRRGILPHEIFLKRRDANEKNESPRHLHSRIYEKFNHDEMRLGKKKLRSASSFELLNQRVLLW